MDKQRLKAAKEALGRGDHEGALKETREILKDDPSNYNALVFQAKALAELGHVGDSEQNYRLAIAQAPALPLAWMGLNQLCLKLKNLPGQAESQAALLKIYAQSQDAQRLQDTLTNLLDIHREEKAGRKMASAFWRLVMEEEKLLASSLSPEVKNNMVPSSPQILLRLLRLEAEEERLAIEKKYDNERKSIRATKKPEQILQEVTFEFQSSSPVNGLYEQLLSSSLSVNDLSALPLTPLRLEYIRRISAILPLFSPEDKPGLKTKVLAQCHAYLQDPHGVDPFPLLLLLRASLEDGAEPLSASLLDSCLPKVGGLPAKMITAQKKNDSGDYAEAKELLEEEASKAQLDAVGWKIYSESCVRIREYQLGYQGANRAKEALEEWGRQWGGRVEGSLMAVQEIQAEAMLHLGKRFWPEAAALFEAILAFNPSHLSALLGLSSLYTAQKRLDLSFALVSRIVELDPNGPTGKGELGWMRFHQNRLEEATELMQEAIALKPNEALLHFRLGRIFWERGGDHQTEKNYAQASFLKAVQLDPKFARPYSFLGRYYLTVARDRVRGRKCFQKALSLDPNDEEAGVGLADILVEDNQLDEALALYHRIVAEDPKATWVWKRLGFYDLLAQQSYEEASRSFQTALRADPGDHACWEGLGECYKAQGKYVAAIKAFSRVLELYPSSSNARFQIGCIRQKLGLFDDARASFLEVLREDPANIPTLIALAETHVVHAADLIALGSYGAAAQGLHLALEVLHQTLSADYAAASPLRCVWKLIGSVGLTFASSLLPYTSLCSPPTLASLSSLAASLLPDTLLPALSEGPGEAPHADPLLQALLHLATQAFKCKLVLEARDQGLLDAAGDDRMARGLFGEAASWGDLACCYYLRSRVEEGAEKATWLLRMAGRMLRVAIRVEPSTWVHWNNLGVAVLRTNAPMSQHALIKAIRLNPKSALAWSNLGYLYHLCGDASLSQQAFSNAQILDPDWAKAWVGQALLADHALKHREALDLYRHSVELCSGSLPEANFRLGKHCYDVMRSGLTQAEADLEVAASFALHKLIEQKPQDAAAHNQLGLISELRGLHSQAANAFLRAHSLISAQGKRSPDHVARISLNLGRAQCAEGRFQEAIHVYTQALGLLGAGTLASLPAHLGLGLGHFYAGELLPSMQHFEQALALCADGGPASPLRPHVALLVCQVLYALASPQHRALAQQELLKLAQEPQQQEQPHKLMALHALASLGLQQNDLPLAGAALAEIQALPPHLRASLDPASHLSPLFARYLCAQGLPRPALSWLQKGCLASPALPLPWRRLAAHVVLHAPELAHVTLSLALSAERTLLPTWDPSPAPTAPDLATTCHLISLSLLHAPLPLSPAHVAPPPSLLYAQRAARLNPGDVISWLGLALTLHEHLTLATAAAAAPGPHVATYLEPLLHALQHVDALLSSPSPPPSSSALSGSSLPRLRHWSRILYADALLLRAQAEGAGEGRQQLLEGSLSLAREVAAAHEAAGPELQAQAHNQIARVLRAAGQPQEAIGHLKQALVLAPSLPPTWLLLSDLYAQVGRFAAAEVTLKLSLAQPFRREHHVAALLQLSRLAWMTSNISLGLEASAEALKRSPRLLAATWIHALFLQKSGNPQASLPLLLEARDERLGLIDYALSRAYHLKGDKAQASRFLKSAKELSPFSPFLLALS